MVDTLVETDIDAGADQAQALWGPYWSDISTGVIVFSDGGLDISFARTTDKGANWSTTQIQAGGVRQMSVWYDKETPGDTGTLLHLAWLDNIGADFAYYRTLDVSDASLGTLREVDNTVTVNTSKTLNRVAITKAVNGNLVFAFATQTEIECYRSDDDGVSWDARADVFETATEEDWVLLFPADVDAGDAAALFWDRSANDISIKMYDESANTWTETSIDTDAADDSIHINMDGAIRHSDKHLLIAFHSNDDNNGDDLRTYDLTVDSIASPTITTKTVIFTNQSASAQVGMFINQQNDDVYLAYMKGGTWQATVDVVYHISTDGMGVWGSEQAYSESLADDFRVVQAGRTVGDDGGRYQPSFFDDDEVDVYINETNDVEIAAAVPAAFASQRLLIGVGI